MVDTDTKKIELLPCPFCGGMGKIYQDQMCSDDHCVECSECNAETGWSPSEASAIAAWNRRASLPLAGDVDGLCKALLSYQQADADGVMVTVSRQACDEAASRIRSLAGRVEAAERERGEALMVVIECLDHIAQLSSEKAAAEARSAALARALEEAEEEAESLRQGAEAWKPMVRGLEQQAEQSKEFVEAFAAMPCETKGPEDEEPGCCRPCRARTVVETPACSKEPTP